MERKVKPSPILQGEVTPPGDKSISHRALIISAISEGESRVSNFSPGLDCRSTMDCLRGLGVKFDELSETEAVVFGRGLRGLREPEDILDAGNSGTTMRLLSGLLGGQSFFSVLTGDASLRSRPMGRIANPLRLMGAQVWGRRDDTLAPLAIKGGSLRGIEYRLPVASAQVKSAILLAALYADGPTTIESPAPSRDHTELMLRSKGVSLEGGGLRMRLTPPTQALPAADIQVPGDISAAAFWLVAGAIHPRAQVRVLGVGINPTRAGILDVLTEMGARLSIDNRRLVGGEEVADISVESSELRGIELGGDMIPNVQDEIPVLAVAASLAQGTTVIRDAAELRVKESDRISTTATQLRLMGAHIEERPDGMVIHGTGKLKGAVCQSYLDHRLAMTLGVAGLVAEGETIVRDAEVAEVSYPGFWEDMARLTAASGR